MDEFIRLTMPGSGGTEASTFDAPQTQAGSWPRGDVLRNRARRKRGLSLKATRHPNTNGQYGQ